MALGADLERAWLHPAATAAARKRILRTALSEVFVRRDGAIIHAVLHWQGGDHTELKVKQRSLWTSRPTYFTDWLIAFASMQEIAPDQPGAISVLRITRRVRAASGEHVV